MKAAIYYDPGDIRIEEIEKPHAGPSGAVVKIEAAEYMEAGKITAVKCVTQVYPLEKTKEAFDMAVNPHESIKVLIEL